jgi:hypothetical protein
MLSIFSTKNTQYSTKDIPMSENPLKQYFRRPAIYFKLPSGGKYYPPGVVNIPPNDELPVYPMTTMDEIALRTPDGLYNGASMVRLIKNCIPDILDPWQLNSIDMDSVIIAIRAASVDGSLDITSICPECGEEGKYGVDLLKMLAEKREIDFTKPLEIHELSIKFRPLTYTESNKNGMRQFEVQKLLNELVNFENTEQQQELMVDGLKKLNELTLDIIAQTIDYIQTPESRVNDSTFIREFLAECDSKTNNAIKEYSTKLKQQNENKPLQMKCVSCQHEYQQALVLNHTDFFV